MDGYSCVVQCTDGLFLFTGFSFIAVSVFRMDILKKRNKKSFSFQGKRHCIEDAKIIFSKDISPTVTFKETIKIE